MEDSRTGTVIMALPLLILVLALVIALYNVGFDVNMAALPENPVGPLEETLTALMQADQPLVTGNAVETDAAAGTVTLKGSVENPTAYPLSLQHLEYRIPGEDGGFTAILASPVTVPPGERVTVELTGAATPDALFALNAGSAEGILSYEIEILGVSITTETPRTWEVEA
ncbi:hypothetical protein [Methanogenium sp. MK-MG]|uniref:hypothetical protein n=1 Tax=Methanogenium sp. MK-MG TaxID=2599926 RepID=UPI0013EDA766|nr:hypothetical protein [Methanogenium sp. MK-MG]KAF1078072.1 hypothetical protein MKMG_00992 [Methanogenium sp. MK-MG]